MVQNRNRQHRKRIAAATIELAVCLPLIVVLVFGALEGANMLFLRQAVVQAAYETVKTAVKADGNANRARELGLQMLRARDIEPASIRIRPGNLENAPAGVPVRVTVSVPGRVRSITNIAPFRDLQIRAQAAMLKE